jgi:Penicillin amidase
MLRGPRYRLLSDQRVEAEMKDAIRRCENRDLGLRAGRITELIRRKLSNRGTISFKEMQAIQADVVLPDAQYFVPFIKQALARGLVSADPILGPLAAQPGIQAAVARLSSWKLTAPTGIPEGYDAADVNGVLRTPSSEEIAESVAATLYSMWRGQFIRNSIECNAGRRAASARGHPAKAGHPTRVDRVEEPARAATAGRRGLRHPLL